MSTTVPFASMSLAAGLAFAVAWQGVNLWRPPHSIPMPMSSTAPAPAIPAPAIKDFGVQFGLTSGKEDSASRPPSEAPSSAVALNDANPASLAANGPQTDEAGSGSQNPGATPQVDETALRYFARQGDVRRLNAEIARLHSLYPDWTPPRIRCRRRRSGIPSSITCGNLSLRDNFPL